MFDFTGVQCYPCGADAMPAMDKAIADHKYKVCPMAINCGGASDGLLYYFNYYGFDQQFNITGTPTMLVGLNQSSTYDFNTDVNAAVAAASARATCGIGIVKSIAGTKLTITTKTQFFDDATGKYNLALYVIENNIIFDQDGSAAGANTVHNHVCRASVIGSNFGLPIIATSIAKGATIDRIDNYTIDPTIMNAANLEVIAVVYKMDASNVAVSIVNSNITKFPE